MPLASDGPSVLAMSVGPEDSPELAETGYDDRLWRSLNLPHDWAVEGDFCRENPSGTGGGALPGGIGWYRKDFRIPASMEEKCLSIEFDGVYMNSTVWINGHELGTRPYGYISFSYDLTPYIDYGGKNTVAVRVDNSDQPNSRWYSGCGIFRPVRLRVAEKAHVAQWGVFARCLEENVLTVTTNCEGCEGDGFEICSELIDRSGNVVAFSKSALEDGIAEQAIPVSGARLWSLSDPYLYELRTTLLENGKETDSRLTPIGIRTVTFDPTRPVIAGCNEPDPGNHLFRSGALDIIGFNYHEGWFAGVDNGSPITLERFKADHRKAFYGKCLVMLRSDGKCGKITVKATSRDGSLSGKCSLEALR